MHDADPAALTAQGEKNLAYANLAGQGCTTTYAGIFKDLATEILAPGVYCADSFHLTGTLTLSGTSADVWIFKSSSDLIISGGASAKVVFSGGGLPCNVWWSVVSTATFDAGSSLVGNILADTSITLAAGATLKGRALARTAEVTLIGNAITTPSCSVPSATLTVTKTVINDNGGTKTIIDFPLFVGATPVTSGLAGTFAPGTYAVTETNSPGYMAGSWGGDCSSTGSIILANGANSVCTITNNDIPPTPASSGGGSSLQVDTCPDGDLSPSYYDDFCGIIVPPLIALTKVPTPLALPSGSVTVIYTYAISNIGKVSINNVTLTDDKCSSVTLVSGDTNADKKLDINEIWTYRCVSLVMQTVTNIAIATGHANGLTTTDSATATVIVGAQVLPPLIHIVKRPNRFVLPFGGGSVTYSYRVINPGAVALSNVSVTDDKCQPMFGHSGDSNGNGLLDTNETWGYACRMNITNRTVNIVTAKERANGLTAVDYATTTVITLPRVVVATGTTPQLLFLDCQIPEPVRTIPITVLEISYFQLVQSSLYFDFIKSEESERHNLRKKYESAS